ncbi:MAG: ADP-forming succinate--CoA ligase subunit beta [Planctomycetota bacterium]
MKIHEYQAKAVLSRHGIEVPEGRVATEVVEAVEIARSFGSGVVVVKAQIHAGGRGKGGGVKVLKSVADVEAAARAIVGMQLVTHQTGPKGQRVRRVLIEKGCDIAREIYLGVVIDRRRETPVMMASAEGGMDIEEIARSRPQAILYETIDPVAGLHPFQGRRLAARLGLANRQINEFATIATRLATAYLAEDCSIAEINPLVETRDGKLRALDAKIVFDDNALFRHPENKALHDPDEEDPQELRAARSDLSYISMDGDIGCMVNGAGLAMATMDIIQHEGGLPANFLDVGGGATAERVGEAFRIILADPKVRSVLVNIFGGIVRCDLIASGIIEAAKTLTLKVPLVVRLAGNKVEEGKKLLESAGLDITPAVDLSDAARKAVAAARGRRMS